MVDRGMKWHLSVLFSIWKVSTPEKREMEDGRSYRTLNELSTPLDEKHN